jgi:hypothetical protein
MPDFVSKQYHPISNETSATSHNSLKGGDHEISVGNTYSPTFHTMPESIPGTAATWAAKSGISHDPEMYGSAVAIGVKIATAIPNDGKNAFPWQGSFSFPYTFMGRSLEFVARIAIRSCRQNHESAS